MKIIIDLQGLQREGNRKRGIGRYCLEFTKALINHYPDNEYILFTNSALCNLRRDFLDEINNQNAEDKLKNGYIVISKLLNMRDIIQK